MASVFDKMNGISPLEQGENNPDLYDDTTYSLQLKRKSQAAFLRRLLMQSDMKDVLSQARIAKERGDIGDDNDYR